MFDRPYDWNQSPLIIPSHFTTQMDMLKSGESDNQAKNLPGYLLSDIKRGFLSSLKIEGALLLVLSGRALLLL